MPKIVVFTSPKGGSGATFACACMCRTLAEKQQKVLALDMCFERCSLDFALGFQDEYIYTLSDVIDGSCSLSEAVCRDEVDFLRADYDNDFFDYDKALDIVKNSHYDYVLIDALSYDKNCIEVLKSVADIFIAVTDCSDISVKLTQSFAEGISEHSSVYVLINKIVPYYIRDNLHLTVDDVLDRIGHNLIGLVPWDCMAQFITGGKWHTLSDYSGLNEPFSNIATRLMGERAAACDIENLFKTATTYKYLTKGRK